jgi:hypothetical protein
VPTPTPTDTPTPAPPPSCGAPQTLTATADAWIDQNSSTSNKGTDSTLKVQSKGPSDNFRALVRFTLPAIPAGCTVDSATLRLYAASYKTGRALDAYQIAANWGENGVTFANQPPLANTTPGRALSGFGYREWIVTDHVHSMYSTGGYHGFMVRDAFEGEDSEQQFNSREKGEFPPQLVLTFRPG